MASLFSLSSLTLNFNLSDASLTSLYYLLFKLFNAIPSYDSLCLKMEYPALWDSKEGIGTIVLCVVFEVLAIAAMMLRIWSRRLKRTTLVINDYAAVIALVVILDSSRKQVLIRVLAGAYYSFGHTSSTMSVPLF
jgi:hypothetical protein